MRSVGVFLVIILLTLSSCIKKETQTDSAKSADASKRVFSFALDNSSFALSNTIEAWVKSVELYCAADNQTYTIDFTDKSKQTFEIVRDITGCVFKLKSFVADKLKTLPMDQALFVLNNENTVLLSGDRIASYYELKNHKQELLDRRLVIGSVVINKDGCPGIESTCDFRNTRVTFSYSETHRHLFA